MRKIHLFWSSQVKDNFDLTFARSKLPLQWGKLSIVHNFMLATDEDAASADVEWEIWCPYWQPGDHFRYGRLSLYEPRFYSAYVKFWVSLRLSPCPEQLPGFPLMKDFFWVSHDCQFSSMRLQQRCFVEGEIEQVSLLPFTPVFARTILNRPIKTFNGNFVKRVLLVHVTIVGGLYQ